MEAEKNTRTKNNFKIKAVWFIVLLEVFSLLVFSYGIYRRANKKEEVRVITKKIVKTTTLTRPELKEESVVIKESALLSVPYTLQGPLDNLSIHEESCEEAAALMYHYFLEGQTTFSGRTVIPSQLANDEMLAMKAWQVKNYGKEPDLSIEKLGLFMQQYYGYKYQTFKNITRDDIKREISAGHPVMVPVMTHSLKNPSYGPKSVYHILVIKGYNAQNVIVNDAGIRGESIQYSWDIVFSAIDTQTPKMGQGREMVVVMK